MSVGSAIPIPVALATLCVIYCALLQHVHADDQRSALERQLLLAAERTSSSDRHARPARLRFHSYMQELHKKIQNSGGYLTVQVGNASKRLGYISAVHSFLDVRCNETDDSDVHLFNVSGIPVSEHILAAELRLHVLRGRAPRNSSWQVYEVLRSGRLQLVDTAYSTASLVSLDVTKLVRRWNRNQPGNHSIVLKQLFASSLHSDDLPMRKRRSTTAGLVKVQPNIVVFTRVRHTSSADNNSSRRSAHAPLRRLRRGARYSSRRKRNRMCSLQKMEVEFDRIGWSDWVYAPGSFQAGICVGSCTFPLSDQIDSTNHAIIQALVHNSNRLVPSPCCVPTKLAPIRLLYYDHETEKATLGQFSNMVALACGCR